MRDLPDSKPAPPVGLPNKTHPNECIIHDPCAPPTLGDYLTQRIIGNGHTHEEVATELDTIPLKVRWWANDSYAPEPEDFSGLMRYLGVDLNVLKGLILRSQMRHTQRRLRGLLT